MILCVSLSFKLIGQLTYFFVGIHGEDDIESEWSICLGLLTSFPVVTCLAVLVLCPLSSIINQPHFEPPFTQQFWGPLGGSDLRLIHYDTPWVSDNSPHQGQLLFLATVSQTTLWLHYAHSPTTPLNFTHNSTLHLSVRSWATESDGWKWVHYQFMLCFTIP